MRVVIATEGGIASEEVFYQLRQIIPSPSVLSELFVITCTSGPALTPGVIGGLPGLAPSPVEATTTAIDRARVLLGPLAVQATFKVLPGPPGPEIVRFTREVGCQLLVVGSRNLHGMDRMLMGSVSTQVVANAPCSVLVIK